MDKKIPGDILLALENGKGDYCFSRSQLELIAYYGKIRHIPFSYEIHHDIMGDIDYIGLYPFISAMYCPLIIPRDKAKVVINGYKEIDEEWIYKE